eukprot:3674659-Pyramimonas_sp.AAC.1
MLRGLILASALPSRRRRGRPAGPPLDPRWTPAGPPLDPRWTPVGPHADPPWTTYGTPADPLRTKGNRDMLIDAFTTRID